MLKDHIAYVHVKDALFDGGRVVPAGQGDGNLKAILARLDGEGYEGFLSLEPHLADFAGLSGLEKNAAVRGTYRYGGGVCYRLRSASGAPARIRRRRPKKADAGLLSQMGRLFLSSLPYKNSLDALNEKYPGDFFVKYLLLRKNSTKVPNQSLL